MSRILPAAAVLLMVLAVIALYRNPDFIWATPAPQLLAGALVALALCVTRLPIAASLFFLAGAASMAWSLTPANTLLNLLWESIYLGALAVGGSVPGFALINVWLLYLGLERTLLLDFFNLTQYFSGSVHYLAGAQGLLFLPLALATAVRSGPRLNRIVAAVVAAGCLVLILNSGARAVYLPAAMLLPLTVARLAVPAHQRVSALTIPVALLALVLGFGSVLPGPTISAPLGAKATQTSTELEGRVAADSGEDVPLVAEEGAIASRLKMWEQSLWIGFSHPFGTGAGSFRDTIHAFQRYPLIGFSSAHNVFLEIFATGGWLRLALLLTLVIGTLWRGWNSTRWPLGVGAAGIWATMSFDITGQMPAIMALGFWSLGSARPRAGISLRPGILRIRAYLSVAVLTVVILAAGWWYFPCSGPECAVERHLGYRREVTAAVRESDEPTARLLSERAVTLNPESYWAWRLRVEQLAGVEERLEASRELARRFPLASPQLYLNWADNALAADRPDEAREAVRNGLQVFPPNLNPAGVPFGGRAASYAEWLERAEEILESGR